MFDTFKKGFRFRKSFKIMPGVKVNISKKGASVSVGPDNAHITTGTHGTYLYLDLPGSGAYFRKKLDTKSNGGEKEKGSADHAAQAEEAKPSIGFLQQLATPAGELELVNAFRKLADGDNRAALEHARKADHLADGAFLVGFLAMEAGQYEEAILQLNKALKVSETLGEMSQKYEVDLNVELPVTEEISAHIHPDQRGVLLALAEAYQQLDMPELAIERLQALHQFDPDDLVVRLALAELLSQQYPNAPHMQQRVIELAQDVHNVSALHASLMLYRARALRRLNLSDGAYDTLTKALRRKKGYPDDLLRGLHYERGLVYEAQGKLKEARKEYQKIYAEAPDYEDVAARLGL